MEIPYDRPFGGYGVGAAPSEAATAARVSVLPQTSAAMGEVAAATRAARVAQHGEAAVAAMEAAGARPANMAMPNLVTPPSATGVTAPSWLKTAGGFGMRALRGAGVIGGIAGASELGGRALEFGANAAANIYVGNAGSNMSPNPAVKANQPAAPLPDPATAASPGTFWDERGGDAVSMGAANLRTAMSPRFAQPATPDNTAVPSRGTGFIQNNQTGATTYIDSRTNPAAPAAPYDYTRGSPAASFFQAGARIRQISGDNAQNLATSKMLLDAHFKGAEAEKNLAQAGGFGIRNLLAKRLAEQGDLAGAAAATGGRSAGTGAVFHESTTSLPDPKTGAISVINGRTGDVSKRTPSTRVTDANIDAYLRDNPTVTRAAAIAAHKARGMDVAGLK